VSFSKERRKYQMKTYFMRLAISLLLVVVLVSVILIGTGKKVQAAAISTFPSNCYSTMIHLNGSHSATVTCMIPGKLINGKMVPDTNQVHPSTQMVNCNTANSNVGIFTYSGALYCFAGTGYLGFNIIQNVSEINEISSYRIWYLAYTWGTGDKIYMTGPSYNDFGSDPTVGITQICIKC
jgi:hypothetical protein